jgi:C_GCAxxG_C_C family probable redox protein
MSEAGAHATDPVEAAVDLFRSGCCCSQAVLAACGGRYGVSEPLALRLASGFAGGMRYAATCGSVTGAYMVLGLAHAGEVSDNAPGRQGVYRAVLAFAEQFRARHGSLECRDLLGCDPTTPEGNRRAAEQGLFVTRCPLFVRDAAEILEELLPCSES